jgi:chloramphenicol 3-O-phosphotransferase
VAKAPAAVGWVVILNGTASAGKTTLVEEIRRRADGVWVVFAQDHFAQSLVPRWVHVDGGHVGNASGLHFVRDAGGSMHVEVGEVGRRVLRGFRFAAAACARVGNDVLVDESMFDEAGWTDWNEALNGLPTLWVQVACDVDECVRREAARSDRTQIQGVARGHFDLVHRSVRYDLSVDLTEGDVVTAAEQILRATQWARRTSIP